MNTLIIDDDKKIHEMFNSFLPFEYQIEPKSAYSASEGIEAIEKNKFDLVICDYHMPPQTGIDVLNYINTLEEKPIVVMLTASDEKELLLKSVESGVFKYIEKNNFKLELIVEVIEKILEHHKETKKDKHMQDLGETLAVVIHEINNPLAVIQGRASILKDKEIEFINDKDKEFYFKSLNSIESSCYKISEIIKDQKNKISLQEKTKIGLNTLFLELEDYLDSKEGIDPNIEINISALNKEDEIRTNKNKVVQVITNLLNNSLDAVSDLDEKWIKMDASIVNNKCHISCIDSGKGVNLEDQTKIFNKYYSNKKSELGTGIGLDLCKKIAHDLGGDLFIDNDSKNTCFKFYFSIV